MTTIRDLAREFNAQPYEVAAFADLDVPETETLCPNVVEMIRDAWHTD